MSEPQSIVAVTLGSNGFHLFPVHPKGNMLEPKDHLYKNTSIQSYMDDQNNISDDVYGKSKPIQKQPHNITDYGMRKNLDIHLGLLQAYFGGW